MRHLLLTTVILLLSSTKALAINPIGWTVNSNLPATTLVNSGTYSAVYTLTNHLPFDLVKALSTTKSASPASEFSYVDLCNGQKLASNASCSVTINYTPTVIGNKRVELSFGGYAKNIVKLPSQTTTATGVSNISISPSTTSPLPSSLSVGSTALYTFRFSNDGSTEATGVIASSNINGFTTNCTSHLAAGASCQVAGQFTPTSTSPATQTVTATLRFNQGAPVSVSSSTMVVNASALSAEVIHGLPSATVTNTDYSVSFKFSNLTSGDVNISSASVAGTGDTNFTQDTNTCPSGGSTFSSNASCQITGRYNKPSAGAATLTATMTPSTPPPNAVNTQTSTTTAGSLTGRTLTFINQCNFKVWFSLNGANRPNGKADIACTTNSDCPTGSVCNPTAGIAGQCFWDNVGPANGNFELAANGGTNSVFIPLHTVAGDENVFWSGNFSGRTGCDGSSSCKTGACLGGGGSKSCAPGVGFGQPSTLAEITMVNNNVDFYDVETINGFHLPISLSPSVNASTPVANPASIYDCGTPGKETATTQNIDGTNYTIGACNWNTASVPSNEYVWVGGGSGTNCASNPGICASNEICGLNIGINKVCGNFMGFWTANEACAVNKANANSYFSCDTYLTSPFPENSYKMTDLYGCNLPSATGTLLNSCFLNGATKECCGCANWHDLGVASPVSPQTELCQNTGTTWNSQVQPGLLWMKTACPSDYTYPFDDKSSTFTCQNGATNTTNYTVTFCAGGNTGLPAGKTEGRS